MEGLKYEFDEKHHLHLLNGKPLTGTSSVEAVMNKPLTWWASGMAVGTLGWLNETIRENGKVVGKREEKERLRAASKMLTKIKRMTGKKWLALLDKAYRAHVDSRDQAAVKGTNLHEVLEGFVKSRIDSRRWPFEVKSDFEEKIKPFVEWSDENVDEYLWAEAHCFNEDLWVGGVTDAGAVLKTGHIVIIDFKSAKNTYAEHFVQAAGYALQVEKNGVWDKTGTYNKHIGNINALIVVPFGAKVFKPEIRFDIEAYKKGFEWCVGLYRLLGYEDEISKNNHNDGKLGESKPVEGRNEGKNNQRNKADSEPVPRQARKSKKSGRV